MINKYSYIIDLLAYGNSQVASGHVVYFIINFCGLLENTIIFIIILSSVINDVSLNPQNLVKCSKI